MIKPDCEIEREDQIRNSFWLRREVRVQPECELDVADWVNRSERPIYFYDLSVSGIFERPVAVLSLTDDKTEEVFKTLVSEWKSETWFLSSVKKRISHAAFLKIIGLGSPALPFIIEELRREPDYWSFALEAITRQDPVPNAGTLSELRDGWLRWAAEHGY